MTEFEYRVIPAPRRGQKARGVKTSEDRFALGIEQALNAMAAEGWAFHRAETLPSEERSGLTSTTTVFRSVLVFQRARITEPAVEPVAMIADQRAAPQADPAPQPILEAAAPEGVFDAAEADWDEPAAPPARS